MNSSTNRLRAALLVPAICLALLGGLAAFVFPPDAASAQEAPREEAKPGILAVKFHADWCGTCREMKPMLTEVQEAFAESSVLFVTFDLTDSKTGHQSRLLSSAIGLDDLWAENGGKTGQLYLLDADEKTVLETVTVEHSVEEVKELLEGLS